MCGIVGTASTEKMKARSDRYAFMKVGLDLDSWRGWESTGIACVPEAEKENPIIYKRALNGRDFINCKETERLLNDIEKFPVVIGHNRAATTGRGNIVDHNAHPFQYGKITLVHNGHIRNTSDLNGANQKADCLVDSSHVAWAMNNMGEKEVLEASEGGFCFVWWNSEARLLNIARNNERPMHWAYASKENTLYFTSEPTQLLHLMRDIEIDEDKGILFPEPWVWYQFKLEDLREVTKVPFAHRQGRRTSTQIGLSRGGNGNSKEMADAVEEWEKTASTGDIGTSELDEIRRDISNFRKKDAKLCGMPTTSKRLQRAKAELGVMGLGFKDARLCTPQAWVKYKNQNNLGAIVAKIRRDGHTIEIGQVKFEDYEKYKKFGTIIAECINVRRGPTNDRRVVGVVSNKQKGFMERRERRLAWEKKLADSSPSVDRICPGPGGTLITIARFYELTAQGCSNCREDLLPKDCEEVTWIHDFPICSSCVSDPKVMELLGVPEHARASGVH